MQTVLRAWLIVPVFALSTAAAHAQSNSDRVWYGGFSLGQTHGKGAQSGQTAFLNLSYDSYHDTYHDTGSGYKLLAGYRFRRYFALEGGYTDFGSFSYTRNFSSNPGSATGTIKLSGFHIEAVGIYPLDETVLVFIKVGEVSMNSKTTLTTSFGTEVERGHDLFLKVGVGVEYRFSPTLGMRVEYEQASEFQKPGTNRYSDFVSKTPSKLSLISVGLNYHF